MKKTIILLALAALVSLVSAQQRAPFPWNKIRVGVEHSHNIVHGYSFGETAALPGSLRNPANSVDLRVTYDLCPQLTLGLFGGFGLVYRSGESTQPYTYADGHTATLSTVRIVDSPWLSLGVEADLHLLPFLGVESPWYDLYALFRAGYTSADLDLSLGVGVAYWPWKWGGLYANVGCGRVGYPYGELDTRIPRFQTRLGVSFRL